MLDSLRNTLSMLAIFIAMLSVDFPGMDGHQEIQEGDSDEYEADLQAAMEFSLRNSEGKGLHSSLCKEIKCTAKVVTERPWIDSQSLGALLVVTRALKLAPLEYPKVIEDPEDTMIPREKDSKSKRLCGTYTACRFRTLQN